MLRDDVADRQLIRGFALMLAPQHLLGQSPCASSAALERMPDRRRRGRLVAEPLQQLDDEGGGEPAVGCSSTRRSRRCRDVPRSLSARSSVARSARGPARGCGARRRRRRRARSSSTSASRSMIATAQVSPIESGAIAGTRDEVDERLEIEPAGGVRRSARARADRRGGSLRTGRRRASAARGRTCAADPRRISRTWSWTT